MKIMFVCTANTCRSAMAEAIFKQMVDDEIYSCGTHAITGSHVSQHTLDVCAGHGIDISNPATFGKSYFFCLTGFFSGHQNNTGIASVGRNHGKLNSVIQRISPQRKWIAFFNRKLTHISPFCPNLDIILP